jgi:hypothetical protein
MFKDKHYYYTPLITKTVNYGRNKFYDTEVRKVHALSTRYIKLENLKKSQNSKNEARLKSCVQKFIWTWPKSLVAGFNKICHTFWSFSMDESECN